MGPPFRAGHTEYGFECRKGMTGLSDDGTDPIWREALDWLLCVRATPEDAALRAGLAQWLAADPRHVKAYARAERVWRLTGALPALDAGARAAPSGPAPVLVSSSDVPPRPPIPPSVIPFRPLRAERPAGRRIARRLILGLAGTAIAASLLAIVAPGLTIRLRADFRTGVAERRDITLDDGTLVSLNAESAIAVAYSGTARQVTLLSGDAFFHVAPGGSERPFSVRVEGMTIVDIGTAFAVDVGAKAVTVAVESGAVQVTESGRLDARLDPGGRLRVERGTGLVQQDKVPPRQIAAWRNGQLLVDNAPIAQVVEELRSYFPGYIIVRDGEFAANRVSGVFSLGDPASALRAALKPHGGAVTQMTPYLLMISGR